MPRGGAAGKGAFRKAQENLRSIMWFQCRAPGTP